MLKLAAPLILVLQISLIAIRANKNQMSWPSINRNGEKATTRYDEFLVR